ncbi:MAG: DUF3369 domain-containing protein [Thiohalomonadaceae bacterium]
MEASRSDAASADQLVFADEEPVTSRPARQDAWKVLIVDDEEDVHRITRLVLSDYELENRGLELYSAYSGAEARSMLREHPDMALILLDVVMETERSGLDLVRHIRSELKNHLIRIILRTGQPGQAPERSVIIEYDINDYKEKTELTAQKLITTVTGALRSYRDLRTIEQSRRGLEQIVSASATLFELQSLRQFVSGVLRQLTALLNMREDSVYLQVSGFAAAPHSDSDYQILAATGQFEHAVGKTLRQALPAAVLAQVQKAMDEGTSLFLDGTYVGYFRTSNGSRNILYVDGVPELTPIDKDLLRIFSTNVAIAFDNIYLHEDNLNTQKELVFALGETIETRSKETGNHVRRVAEYCRLLGSLLGLSEEEVQMLWMIAPMHDLGKIGIPDAILAKPGPLTAEEWEVVKTHTTIGSSILKAPNSRVLNNAAVVALQHHEHWDGKGYPQGLKGERIHIYGRIVALADVFDALGCRRAYKAPWTLGQILDYVREQRGRQFDPELVDLLLENVEAFMAIRDAWPDETSAPS